MLGALIGQGNTAEVYLWGDKEILKLFRQKFPWEGVEREYQVSKEVEKLGLPVLDHLENLPEESALCHGDFHPGNVMDGDERTVILDWMTATAGSPAADVARTILLLRDAALPESMPGFVKIMLKFFRRKMADSYFKSYQRLSGMSKEEVAGWRLPILAARLTEWVPESEKSFILKEINKAVGA